MTPSIREIGESDLPEIQRLIALLPGLASDRPSVHWLFPNFLKETSFVATKDKEICGFVLGFVNQTNPNEAYLYLIGVPEQYWNIKIGSQLVDRFCNAAKAKGCHNVILTTTLENQRALKFYRAKGFSEPQNFLKTGQPRLKLNKELC